MGKAIIDLEEAYLLNLLTSGRLCEAYDVVTAGLPTDARILDARFDHWGSARLEILIESAQLPESPEGEMLPHLPLVLSRVRGA